MAGPCEVPSFTRCHSSASFEIIHTMTDGSSRCSSSGEDRCSELWAETGHHMLDLRGTLVCERLSNVPMKEASERVCRASGLLLDPSEEA